ncbi:glycoside hydrolase superfamily [Mariannaea sp. PMI_226]|nr:glycoside hydrolase superfamily [Mariannaea sp. PMI_226]
MRSVLVLGAAAITGAGAVAATAAADPRYVLYFDQYHITNLPNTTITKGINYVNTAFANSSLFASEPAGLYTPFQPLEEIRSMFDDGVKVCMAIGGWGDTAGFSAGATTAASRKSYAKNVADTLERLGYDCVDIDWEYPGGNGEDYRQNPNSQKVSEIKTFPLLLAEIKSAIGDKEMSVAVPGLERDMIAFTAEQVPKINDVVDFVNVMSYDLMNRRDNSTKHHASVQGTINTVNTYITRGFHPSKLNVGIPFYAKWFTTKKGVQCTHPIGCPTELLEDANGDDTGLSGALTFEKANVDSSPPTTLTFSLDNSCGTGTSYKCGELTCCSQYGYCGNTTEFCATGCQSDYGRCEGVDLFGSFHNALAKGQTDTKEGGQWYWDSETSLFWTWDTPELISKKMDTLLKKGTGGFMAWSLGEDSYDWSHLQAIQKGFSEKSSS